MTFKVSSDYTAENKYILQKKKQDKDQISFKGIESLASNFCAQVQTGEILGPAIVDIVSMIAPRTIVDSTRSKDAGIETGLREICGFLNNCVVPGFIAVGVSWMLGKFINPELKVNAAIPISSDTLEMFNNSWKNVDGHKFWEEGADKKQVVQRFIENVLNKTHGLAGKEWLELANKPQNEVKSLSGEIAELFIRTEKASGRDLKNMKDKLVQLLGASEHIKVIDGDKHLQTTADMLIKNMHKVSKEIFTKFEPDKVEPVIKKINKVAPAKTLIALAVVVALGISQQFINRYMTKKRTGSDAFVGLSEESKKQADAEKNDKNKKIKLVIAKTFSAAASIGLAAATLAWSINPKKISQTLKPRNLIKKLEFNSIWPNLNQLRSLIYPSILVGRVLASSDKNELRETNIRDIPGFLNWLVLGGFVSKWFGKKISGGKLVNTSKPLNQGANLVSRIGHFLTNESLVSHAEIDAMFKNGKITETLKKSLSHKLNFSIFTGVAYSTLALGFFTPMLNKFITNKLTEKKKNELNLAKSVKSNLQAETPVSQEKKQPKNLKISDKLSGNPVSNEIITDFVKLQQKIKKI